jgi:hypothetical protein
MLPKSGMQTIPVSPAIRAVVVARLSGQGDSAHVGGNGGDRGSRWGSAAMVGQLGAARDSSSVTGCGSACVIIATLMPLSSAAGLIATSEAFHRMD